MQDREWEKQYRDRKGNIEESENEKTGLTEYFAKVTYKGKFIAEALFDTLAQAQAWIREKQTPPKSVTING